MKDRTRAARRTVVGKTPARQPRVNAHKWYRIENLVDRPSAAAIYIYDVIGCTCWWDDECRCVTAMNLIEELQSLRVDELHIHINSPGGEVDDGIAIYNTLRNHRARKTTFIDSLAASAASFIALASDEVVIAETGQVMIHKANTVEIGNADDMRRCADLLERYDANIAGIYAKKSGREVEEFLDLMRAETWFTGVEAVEAGLADRTDADPDEEDGDEDMRQRMTARHNLSLFAFRYQGREAAPAPQLTNHTEAAEPAEPVAEPEPEAVVDAPPADPDPVAGAAPAEPVGDSAAAPEAVSEPEVRGSDADDTAQPIEVDDSPADEPEPEPAEPPADQAPADVDVFAQHAHALLSAIPALSNPDDAFAALKEGLLS